MSVSSTSLCIYRQRTLRSNRVITENIKHKQLSYTYWSGFSGLEDKPENYSLVTYTLTEKGPDCTNLRWTQKGFANEDAYRHSSEGIQDFLKKIKDVTER